MRKYLTTLFAFAILALCCVPSAEAGPIRRGGKAVARGTKFVAKVASAPVRFVFRRACGCD